VGKIGAANDRSADDDHEIAICIWQVSLPQPSETKPLFAAAGVEEAVTGSIVSCVIGGFRRR